MFVLVFEEVANGVGCVGVSSKVAVARASPKGGLRGEEEEEEALRRDSPSPFPQMWRAN